MEIGSHGTLPRSNGQTWTLHEKCSCMCELNCMFPLSHVEKYHITKEYAVRGMKELVLNSAHFLYMIFSITYLIYNKNVKRNTWSITMVYCKIYWKIFLTML